MPKLPKPPNPLKGMSEAVAKIQKVAEEMTAATEELDKLGTGTMREAAVIDERLSASNVSTFKYQLDLIIDDLEHLETEHLPQKGRIADKPCDCIAKAARSLRRHALETIPIAARQGKESRIFSEIGEWANHLVSIGTLSEAASGKHDSEYLEQAGVASNYRKQMEQMLSACPECKDLSELVERIKG